MKGKILMLNEAITIASKLANKKQRICAIITDKRGRIVSTGCNSYTKSHPRMAYYCEVTKQQHKIFLHAELDAIIKTKRKIPNTIYIARVDKQGIPLPCQPCEICKLAIQDAGIKNIIHT
jgi:deoxycytidylate deaminase